MSRLCVPYSYSWNEGVTWQSYTFSEEKLRIRWITTDADSVSRSFLLYGESVSSSSSTSNAKAYPRLIKIDFTGMHERRCTEEDFERWTLLSPTDECVLGRRITYARRKQLAECYIDDRSPTPTIVEITNCTCTIDDFEWYVRASARKRDRG